MIQLNSPTRATSEELTMEEEKAIVSALEYLCRASTSARATGFMQDVQRLIDNYQNYKEKEKLNNEART